MKSYNGITRNTDPTAFTGVTYAGQKLMWIYDYRGGNPEECVGNWCMVNAYLFTAQFNDHDNVEIRCNPEFGQEDAYVQAEKYGRVLGRLPELFRSRVENMDLNKGESNNG